MPPAPATIDELLLGQQLAGKLAIDRLPLPAAITKHFIGFVLARIACTEIAGLDFTQLTPLNFKDLSD